MFFVGSSVILSHIVIIIILLKSINHNGPEISTDSDNIIVLLYL